MNVESRNMTPISIQSTNRMARFHNLMKFRVREILLVSSHYDAFVLEEDGRLSERIFSEYLDLDLRFVPRITRVANASEALKAITVHSFDLIITTTRLSDMNLVDFGRKIREMQPDLPLVLLTYEPIEEELLDNIRKHRSVDRVFHWAGNAKILLSIVKTIEDFKNIQEDTKSGVQVILIIDSSPESYSSFLPTIYTEIMTQTRELISEGINNLDRLLRMRARPKILIAEDFESGMQVYEKYKRNLLGLIMNYKFFREGRLVENVAFEFAKILKNEINDLPTLVLSERPEDRIVAQELNTGFLNSRSQNLLQDISKFIIKNFGFGDFIFRYPDGTTAGRASNLQEFATMIQTVPRESLIYHASRNHISIWLRARTEFELADYLRPVKVSDFDSIDVIREFLYRAIFETIEKERQGVISDFSGSELDLEKSFVRLGTGSLGGKARGIAFINHMLAGETLFNKYEDAIITTPQSFVLCTDIYEEFISSNNLLEDAIHEKDDDKIAKKFIETKLSMKLKANLRDLLKQIDYPLAVRSSSLLEDSQALPFAGLYSTYMLPNNHENLETRLKQLSDSIKLIYASVFYQTNKSYITDAGYRLEEEKMAVIIQQIVGQQHDNLFYPVVSGLAQSYSFYPLPYMKGEDGIMHLALGLGKAVVEGERTYMVSPNYPRKNPVYSSPKEFIKNSQSEFYALSLSNPSIKPEKDEAFSLERFDLARAEKDGTLFFVGSTYSAQKRAIQDTLAIEGPRIVTFANMLKYNIFPLSEITRDMLKLGKEAFGCHVELEFAVNLYHDKSMRPEFHFLQIRPIASDEKYEEVTIGEITKDNSICASTYALGNGILTNIHDIVYVDPEKFSISESRKIASEVGIINREIISDGRKYILAGFGRWGSTDEWLGIPIIWNDISGAIIIIEATFKNLKTDPSYGSHFFHNLLAQKTGYLHVRKNTPEEFVNWQWLRAQKSYKELQFIRHLRFDESITVKIDGRTTKGQILKPFY